ncbi:MAG: DNA translocase FtsK [Alistipes sp.]|nr:DNA translocase FtsK [Alistipes sp.]
MAKSKDTKKESKKRVDETPIEDGAMQPATRRENIQWMTGFMLLSLGIFLLCSIVSYFFYWREDMASLYDANPIARHIYNNVCGKFGARAAQYFVGDSFGVFAMAIPIYALMLGWRMFRSKRLRIGFITTVFLLVLLLGSVTLAYIFNTNWELFGSGLGGEYGLALNAMLRDALGSIGALLVILAGWLLTGLFINRNFLRAVDTAGEHVAGGVSGVASWLWSKMHREKQRVEDDIVEGEADVEPVVAQPQAPHPQPVAEPVFTSQPREEVTPQPAQQPAPQPVQQYATQPTTSGGGITMSPASAMAAMSAQGSPFVSVGSDSDIEVDADGNIVNNEPQHAEPKVVDDYPFKDPSAPLEEYVEIPQSEARPAVIDMSQMTTHNSGVFSTMPREADVVPVAAPISMPEPQHDPEPEEEGMVITVEKPKPQIVDADDVDMEVYDPMRDLYKYVPPMPNLLVDHKSNAVTSDQEIFDNKERIRETLLNFGIPIRSMHATVGPTVTLYEIVQEQGVKISKIQGLENDIAQSLKALGIRIIAPIPGRGTIGIEVPNHTKQTVSMYSAICSKEFQESKAQLPVVIGRTIQNENYTFDLAKMPHLLVAGATGQGKSVGLNAIITSLLYRKHPAELKFVLIDPKMVEFSLYNKLEKHFLAKMESEDEAIVTDPKKAVYTLNSLCTEMANRLELCKQAHAKNIVEYNEKFLKRSLNPENGHKFMPYIVVVIDEFADLIMTAKEVEAPVMRLAQKARAVGIHLIVATQRPDVRVITGGIKANFPARIAFRVMQMTDSRTIIDQPGANQLIGRGDMLLSNGGELTRIQCAFVDTPEVENIVEHIGRQQGYASAYALPDYTPEQGGGESVPSFGSEESSAPQKYDPKFGEIAREAVSSGMISTSMIQRNFEVGFNRAGRIMLQLERAGIVGPQIGSKPREIKYYDLPSLEARLQELGVF